MTTSPENPFAASEIGELYRAGRPYHHPRSLARVRAVVEGAVVEGAVVEGAVVEGAVVEGAGAGATMVVDRALDVACGTGMSAVALAQYAATVVGIDVSPEMMRLAPPTARVSYTFGDAERLPFADAGFDAVTCASGVHWFDPARFFAELRRVVRPGGWIGLYDHYFTDMQGVDEFRAWIGELFARYPLPARNPQVGDPRAETPAGFELLGTESFDDPIEMTPEAFAAYQLSVSHCVAAVERGTPRSEIHDWLLASTAPLFGDSPTRVLQFVGLVTCLRRLP